MLGFVVAHAPCVAIGRDLRRQRVVHSLRATSLIVLGDGDTKGRLITLYTDEQIWPNNTPGEGARSGEDRFTDYSNRYSPPRRCLDRRSGQKTRFIEHNFPGSIWGGIFEGQPPDSASLAKIGQSNFVKVGLIWVTFDRRVARCWPNLAVDS